MQDTLDHLNLLPECKIMFKQLEDKIDTLISDVKTTTDKNDAHGHWLIGIMCTIILVIMVQIGTFLFMWGQLTKTVEINSNRILSIEELHPRLSN
jgi:hypothetical protein